MKIKVIRSNRKTMALEINANCEVLVRAPYEITDRMIRDFVISRQDWLNEHLELMQKRQEEMERKGEKKENLPKFSNRYLQKLSLQAKEVLPKRAAYYAKQMGVSYERITIRRQKTRWGSCSSKKNLNFNCLLMLCPKEVQDYVVVHELCHLREMNHSRQFWALVETYMPDYRIHRKWLKDHGGELIKRLP